MHNFSVQNPVTFVVKNIVSVSTTQQKCHKIQSDVYGEETEKREREDCNFTHDIELYYWIVFFTQRRAALERIARRGTLHPAPFRMALLTRRRRTMIVSSSLSDDDDDDDDR